MIMRCNILDDLRRIPVLLCADRISVLIIIRSTLARCHERFISRTIADVNEYSSPDRVLNTVQTYTITSTLTKGTVIRREETVYFDTHLLAHL